MKKTSLILFCHILYIIAMKSQWNHSLHALGLRSLQIIWKTWRKEKVGILLSFSVNGLVHLWCDYHFICSSTSNFLNNQCCISFVLYQTWRLDYGASNVKDAESLFPFNATWNFCSFCQFCLIFCHRCRCFFLSYLWIKISSCLLLNISFPPLHFYRSLCCGMLLFIYKVIC